MVILLVYVDDLIITGSTADMIDELKYVLNRNFKMKYLGNVRYFSGIEEARNSDGIVLNQIKYCLKLVYEVAGLSGTKPVKTPMVVGLKLTTVDYDNLFK